MMFVRLKLLLVYLGRREDKREREREREGKRLILS